MKCASHGSFNCQPSDVNVPPFCNTVERIHHSLVELSLALHKNPRSVSHTFSTECDQPHEGFVAVDGDAKSTHRSCFENKKVVPSASSEILLSDDEFSYSRNTSNFFEEVISAVEMKNLGPFISRSNNQSKNVVNENAAGSPDNVFTNVLEWGWALRSVPSLPQNLPSCKLGKKKLLRKHMSLQERQFRDHCVGANSLMRRHSDADRHAEKKASNNVITLFSRMEEERFNDDCTLEKNLNASLLDSCDAHEPEFVDTLALDVCQIYVRDHENHDIDMEPLETPKKKDSITSADLEHIFSDFADRSTGLTVSDHEGCYDAASGTNQPVQSFAKIYQDQSVMELSLTVSDHESCDDDASRTNHLVQSCTITDQDQSVMKLSQSLIETDHSFQLLMKTLCSDNSSSACSISSVGKYEAVMVSRSCQTESRDKAKLEKTEQTQTNPVPECSLVHATSPPAVNNFLERTGNWAKLLKKTKETQTNEVKEAYAETRFDPVLVDTCSAPNIHLQFAGLSSPSVRDDFLKFHHVNRPIQPASHMHALESVPPPSKMVHKSHDRTLHLPESVSLTTGTLHPQNRDLHKQGLLLPGNVADDKLSNEMLSSDSSLSFPSTPNKLSFHGKLSLFESRSNTTYLMKQKPVCFEIVKKEDQQPSPEAPKMLASSTELDQESQKSNNKDGKQSVVLTSCDNGCTTLTMSCKDLPQSNVFGYQPEPCLPKVGSDDVTFFLSPRECTPCDGNESTYKKIQLSSDGTNANCENTDEVNKYDRVLPIVCISPPSNSVKYSDADTDIVQNLMKDMLDSVMSSANSDIHVLGVLKQRSSNVVRQSCQSTNPGLTPTCNEEGDKSQLLQSCSSPVANQGFCDL